MTDIWDDENRLPLGGDFTRGVNNTFKVLNSDRRICRNDNGTDVCDLGHKLKFPGTCLSQFLGTFNSTDPTFQPTFPICVTDFQSSGFSAGTILSSQSPNGLVVSVSSLDEVSSETLEVIYSQSVEGLFHSYNFDNIITGDAVQVKVDSGVFSSSFLQSVPSGQS